MFYGRFKGIEDIGRTRGYQGAKASTYSKTERYFKDTINAYVKR